MRVIFEGMARFRHCGFHGDSAWGFPQVPFGKLQDRFGTRGDLQLGVDVLQVEFHGAFRDAELEGDLLVAFPLQQDPGNVLFAFRQRRVFVGHDGLIVQEKRDPLCTVRAFPFRTNEQCEAGEQL